MKWERIWDMAKDVYSGIVALIYLGIFGSILFLIGALIWDKLKGLFV